MTVGRNDGLDVDVVRLRGRKPQRIGDGVHGRCLPEGREAKGQGGEKKGVKPHDATTLPVRQPATHRRVARPGGCRARGVEYCDRAFQ